MEKAASKGFLSSHKFVNRSGEEMQINHLLFADDTLVFCKDLRDKLTHLNWILYGLRPFQGRIKLCYARGESGGCRGSSFCVGLQLKEPPNDLFGSSFGYAVQLCFHLGWSRRKVQKEVSKLEETIYLKRGKISSFKKHPLQLPNLHHVSLLLT